MGSHSVTCHLIQVNTPCLNPSQTGWYSIYLTQRDGVDLGDLLNTEMVYPSTDGHPSKYKLGPVLINYVDQSQCPNHYSKLPQLKPMEHSLLAVHVRLVKYSAYRSYVHNDTHVDTDTRHNEQLFTLQCAMITTTNCCSILTGMHTENS